MSIVSGILFSSFPKAFLSQYLSDTDVDEAATPMFNTYEHMHAISTRRIKYPTPTPELRRNLFVSFPYGIVPGAIPDTVWPASTEIPRWMSKRQSMIPSAGSTLVQRDST